MFKVGVIAEYNPFHNGHLYHLNKVKEMFPDSFLILVLIGNFTQRGDPSIINKWDKTKLALKYGFDLVVELPFLFATSSANTYAKASIDILNCLKCDYLVFGSETNDTKLFEKLVYETKNKKYEEKIKDYLDDGFSYPKALSLALKDISNVIVDKPNDILALEYIRNIIDTNSKIKPISIQRTNDYNGDEIFGSITSATSIRKNIKNKKLIKKTLPNDSLKLIKDVDMNKFFDILKYKIIIDDDLSNYVDVNEELKNKLKKEIFNCKNLDELILKVKSKRYSYNRIKRMLLHVICSTKKDYDKEVKYIRVLGFNKNGIKKLKGCKNIKIPIITKFKKECEALFEDDIKASKIYSLITEYDYNEDFQSSIRKSTND